MKFFYSSILLVCIVCCCCCCLLCFWCLFDKNDCTLDFLLKHQPSGIKNVRNERLETIESKNRLTIRFNVNVNYASTKQLDSQLRLGYTNKYVLCIVLVHLVVVVLLLLVLLVYQNIYNICQKICYRSWCLLKYVCFCFLYWFSFYKYLDSFVINIFKNMLCSQSNCIFSGVLSVCILCRSCTSLGAYIAK